MDEKRFDVIKKQMQDLNDYYASEEMGVKIKEAALMVSLVSDIPFEDANQDILQVLRAFTQPSCEEVAKKLKYLGIMTADEGEKMPWENDAKKQ